MRLSYQSSMLTIRENLYTGNLSIKNPFIRSPSIESLYRENIP